MISKETITVELSVLPDMSILTKLANDYELRATTHASHEATFNRVGLNVTDLSQYYHDVIIMHASRIMSANKGERLPYPYLKSLYVPVGFATFASALGNVDTGEYFITPIVSTNYNVQTSKEEADKTSTLTSVLYLTEKQHHEISDKLFNLRNIMPCEKNQFASFDGRDAMFGILDQVTSNDVDVKVFSGKGSIDDIELYATVVLGLKVQSKDSNLYPYRLRTTIHDVRDALVEKIN